MTIGSSQCSRCGEPPADHVLCQECESWVCVDTSYEWESHKQGCPASQVCQDCGVPITYVGDSLDGVPQWEHVENDDTDHWARPPDRLV